MLRSIAFAAEEPVLLTFEGSLLLAFDALDGTLKWRLELPRPVAAVVFGAPHALGLASATSPWRSGLSGSTAIAVDVDGGAHIVDARTGVLAQSQSGVGAPVSVASAVDAFAIATKDRVFVWREGAKTEHEMRATAVAFSHDGTELAIGTKGALTVFEGDKRKDTAVNAAIHALAWHPKTDWLAGTDGGIYDSRHSRFVLEGRIRSIAIDRQGVQVAIPRGDRSVQIVSWPTVSALPTRVVLRGRAVKDVGFGPNNLLGVALNRGDASIVDLGARTSKSASRELAAWKLTVELEAPPRPPAPPPETPAKWKAGFGGFGLIAVGARLLFALMRTSSSPSYTPPPDLSKILVCDTACETQRLHQLVGACNDTPAAQCSDDADSALASFREGDCDGTRKFLAAIDVKRILAAVGTPSVELWIARDGLLSACPKPIPDGLVRLTANGSTLMPEHIDLPTLDGEAPSDVYSPHAGTVFVTAVDHGAKTCRVYQSAGQPFESDTTIEDCTSAKLFGRDDDVYVAMGTWVGHFEDGTWTTSFVTTERVLGITGAPEADGDLFVTTAENHLLRSHAGKLSNLPLPTQGVVLGAMAYSVDTLLLDTVDKAKHVLLRRGTDARWVSTKGAAPDPLFGGPNGLVLAGHASELDVSTDKGATWTLQQKPPFRIEAIWARSTAEVYAGGSGGVLRLADGGWARTSFGGPVTALTGNDREIYAVVAHAP